MERKNIDMQESVQQMRWRDTTSYPHKIIFSVQDALSRSNDISTFIRCCLTKHQKTHEVKAGLTVGVRITFELKIITCAVIKDTLYHNPAGRIAQAGKSLRHLLWTVRLNVATEECGENCNGHVQRDQTIHLPGHSSPRLHHHLLLATVAHICLMKAARGISLHLNFQYRYSHAIQIAIKQIKTIMRYYIKEFIKV